MCSRVCAFILCYRTSVSQQVTVTGECVMTLWHLGRFQALTPPSSSSLFSSWRVNKLTDCELMWSIGNFWVLTVCPYETNYHFHELVSALDARSDQSRDAFHVTDLHCPFIWKKKVCSQTQQTERRVWLHIVPHLHLSHLSLIKNACIQSPLNAQNSAPLFACLV